MKDTDLASNRLSYITRYRGFLIFMVLLIHVGITYGAAGGWYFTEEHSVEWLKILGTFIGSVSQSFVLGAFFFISASFLPGSLRRKGAGRLLLDKLLRLGVPFAFYYLVLNSFAVWAIEKWGNGAAAPFRFIPGSGPLWFVQVLFFFTLIYIITAAFSASGGKKGPEKAEVPESNLPKTGTVVVFILLAGLVGFIVRIWYPLGRSFSNLQFGFFPMYVALFIIGLRAGKERWLYRMAEVSTRTWILPTVILLVVQPLVLIFGGALENTEPFMGGFHWQNGVYAFWEAACGTCLIFLTMSAAFRRDRRLAAGAGHHRLQPGVSFGDASMSVLLFHGPVIILGALLMLRINLHPGIKYLIIAAAGSLVPWGLAFVLRKIPGMRKII